jgi:integrase
MPRPDTGSVYQRHDHKSCPPADPETHVRPEHRCYGHWVAAVTLPNGKRAVRYRDTRREAETARRELLIERDRGGLRGQSTTVGEWLDHWYATTARTRVRPSTLAGYRSKIEQYLRPLLGRRRIDQLKPSDIERAWAELSERGLAPRTIAQAHTILHSALGKAVKDGLLPSNPAEMADRPPVRREPPVVFAPEQVAHVLETAKSDRMAARWWIALTLGLRQGEALGLRWSDVVLEPQPGQPATVTVRQTLQRVKGEGLVVGAPKSLAGYRTIPMRPGCVTALRQWRERQEQERLRAGNFWRGDEHDLVFTNEVGGPIDASTDWQAWRDLLERAGIPPVKLHAARHTAVTHWLLAGVPIHTAKIWAGHASITLTSDTYGGLVPQMHEAGMAALERVYPAAGAIGGGVEVDAG